MLETAASYGQVHDHTGPNTYKQIRTELERLQREADAARKAEAAGVIAKMKKTIEEYGLTAADLGLDAAAGDAAAQPSAKAVSKSASRKAVSKKASAKKTAPSGAGVAKYHDPKSGKSWSGFGRVPGWLAEKKNPEAFRVGAGASPAEPQAAPAPAAPQPEAAAQPASKKAAKKAGAKAAGKKAAGKKAPARKAAAKKAAAEGPAADNGATPEPAADQGAPAAGDEAAPPA